MFSIKVKFTESERCKEVGVVNETHEIPAEKIAGIIILGKDGAWNNFYTAVAGTNQDISLLADQGDRSLVKILDELKRVVG